MACLNVLFQNLLGVTKESYGENWPKFCACDLPYLKKDCRPLSLIFGKVCCVPLGAGLHHT
jgi:hypothetical protein